MSRPYDGNAMGRPPPQAGSVRRARERAKSGLPRGDDQLQQPDTTYGQQDTDRNLLPSYRGVPSIKPPKPRAPIGIDGNTTPVISRPTPIPQWPLAGPVQSPVDSENMRPYTGPGEGQGVPQRPPRPSVVLSILDQSRVQEPTPVFLSPHTPTDRSRIQSQDYGSSAPPTPSSRLTTSSVGSIPDFPIPAAANQAASRRSSNLGPPPSSRRGMSSYYSTTSYVSPIPEESAGSRSHGSYASSAAMPGRWGEEPSPATSSTFGDAFYDDSVSEDSRGSRYAEEFGDESSLVRRASLGQKGRPHIITTGPSNGVAASRPSIIPVQPEQGGNSPFEVSTSSSNTLPTTRNMAAGGQTSRYTGRSSVTSEAILEAYAAATASNPSLHSSTPPPETPVDRFEARRPPRLDIDAVRAAEARGSLTSLPDLIRRATRLAAIIDTGKRPASRFDDLFLNEKPEEKNQRSDPRRSGLSDMLAAFPPPAQVTREVRPLRNSWFRTTSWPLAPGRQDTPQGPSPLSQPPEAEIGESKEPPVKQKRRCCGLPMWAFILVIILLIIIIAAAVIIPLQFFVFKTLGNHATAEPSLDQCRTTLTCKNGGTNVVTQGVCSCICTNGFTGRDCTGARSDACTTTNLVSADQSQNIDNVTLGKAIPRLIADAQGNFSIPLSGTVILAKLNSDSLSCIAQNSLVTFNRQSTRLGDGNAAVKDVEELGGEAPLNAGPPISFLTLRPGDSVTVAPVRTLTQSSMMESSIISRSSSPTNEITKSEPPSSPPRTTTPASSQDPPSTTTAAPPAKTSDLVTAFAITEEMLDFARVAVLFVLQEQTSEAAVAAQTDLQRFFSEVQRAGNDGATSDKRNQAASLVIGGNNKINLIGFTVDIGNGPIGRAVAKRAVLPLFLDQPQSRRGGSSLPKPYGSE